ncbi:hypothetical protein HPB48_009242 [Haemaphysalis longicornis]|uniref:Uncharacterized protein n=1 Tax=Haemaphysalis longicornis TaxID=44386 RepID=A0A9J6GX86_HAELO|nr:hypothetical protein HPB48_009242 [Haemaphysalis longicornis]
MKAISAPGFEPLTCLRLGNSTTIVITFLGKKVPFMVYVGRKAHGRPQSRMPQDLPQGRRVPARPTNSQMLGLRRSTDFGPTRVPPPSVLSAEAPIQRPVSHIPRGSYHRSTAEREEACPRTRGVPAHCLWMLAKRLQTNGPNPGTGETVPRNRPKAEGNQDVAPMLIQACLQNKATKHHEGNRSIADDYVAISGAGADSRLLEENAILTAELAYLRAELSAMREEFLGTRSIAKARTQSSPPENRKRAEKSPIPPKEQHPNHPQNAKPTPSIPSLQQIEELITRSTESIQATLEKHFTDPMLQFDARVTAGIVRL